MAQCLWRCYHFYVIMIQVKISESTSIAKKALLSRIALWEGIENEIKKLNHIMKNINLIILMFFIVCKLCSGEFI